MAEALAQLRAARDSGFSLIESLIALAVLAIASAGLIRATEAHVDLIRGLQQRAIAGWIAENRLVELNLPGAPTPPATVDMLGSRWRVATSQSATADPALHAVIVTVAPEAGGASTSLRGFVDAGAAE